MVKRSLQILKILLHNKPQPPIRIFPQSYGGLAFGHANVTVALGVILMREATPKHVVDVISRCPERGVIRPNIVKELIEIIRRHVLVSFSYVVFQLPTKLCIT